MTCAPGYGPAGRSNGANSTQDGCAQCSAGFYSPGGNAACAAMRCDPGRFSEKLGSNDTRDGCSLCPDGSYCTGGSAQSVLCPLGQYSFSLAPTSRSACVMCGQGKIGKTTGAVSCDDCPAGTFQDQVRAPR